MSSATRLNISGCTENWDVFELLVRHCIAIYANNLIAVLTSVGLTHVAALRKSSS